MLTCEKATRLISDGMEQPLGLSERVRLRMHLWICDGCANFAQQAKVLRQLTRRYASGLVGGTTDDRDDKPASMPPPGDREG